MNRLTLTLAPDDDGTAELRGSVEGEGFSGSGAAWFDRDALEAFCASLAAYPIDRQSPPALAGGYWDGQKLRETHLSVRVVPYDALGALQVSVHLGTPAAGNEPADRGRGVTTWFLAGYNDLDRFRAAFAKVLNGAADEAVLTSTWE
ncbi:MAG: hypothetical protein EPO51_20770 [Phenylobacterium sp.]|uniref:hypothetical protein n=1 Tax=Phenylobacterium sp. TaxID=1871053 RepID=UPI001206A8FF|nr:hypothetical protein [Phenylobacterium sp.]TAJ69957.1 MAG: hypothetical protein EPO51_20770 [Phenylobacterium sp.]